MHPAVRALQRIAELLVLAEAVCGNRDVVGQSIELNHKLYTVIGVNASAVHMGRLSTCTRQECRAPIRMNTGCPFIKLKPGVKHTAAAAEFQVLWIVLLERSQGFSP